MSKRPDLWEADDIEGLAQAVDGFSPDQYVDLQAEQAAVQAAERRGFLAGVGESEEVPPSSGSEP